MVQQDKSCIVFEAHSHRYDNAKARVCHGRGSPRTRWYEEFTWHQRWLSLGNRRPVAGMGLVNGEEDRKAGLRTVSRKKGVGGDPLSIVISHRLCLRDGWIRRETKKIHL